MLYAAPARPVWLAQPTNPVPAPARPTRSVPLVQAVWPGAPTRRLIAVSQLILHVIHVLCVLLEVMSVLLAQPLPTLSVLPVPLLSIALLVSQHPRFALRDPIVLPPLRKWPVHQETIVQLAPLPRSNVFQDIIVPLHPVRWCAALEAIAQLALLPRISVLQAVIVATPPLNSHAQQAVSVLKESPLQFHVPFVSMANLHLQCVHRLWTLSVRRVTIVLLMHPTLVLVQAQLIAPMSVMLGIMAPLVCHVQQAVGVLQA